MTSVADTFGAQVDLEIRTAEQLITDHQEMFLDPNNESVTKRRYEMEFLNSVGFLRDFIEENRKAGHRGRLVILFKDNDRIPRMRSLCESAKLSETNNKDSRWHGPVNLLSRVNALEELLENATTVADNWVDEYVRYENKTRKTTTAMPRTSKKKEDGGGTSTGVPLPVSPTGEESHSGEADAEADEDSDDLIGAAAKICEDLDSEDEQEFFAKRKKELLDSTSRDASKETVSTKKFMKPPPLTQKPSIKIIKQNTIDLPQLKETKLLDLADEEEKVFTNEKFQVEREAPSERQPQYVRPTLQSVTRISDGKVQSFVPLGQKPEQPVKLRSVPKKEESTAAGAGGAGEAESGSYASGEPSGRGGGANGSSSSSSPQESQAGSDLVKPGVCGSPATSMVSSAPGGSLPSASSMVGQDPQAAAATPGAVDEGGVSSSSTSGETRAEADSPGVHLPAVPASPSLADGSVRPSPGEAVVTAETGQGALLPAAGKPPPSEQVAEPRFLPNDMIVICGLKSEKAASFNGREGIILGYVAETKKYDALIDGKTRIMVKGENLKAKGVGGGGVAESARLVYEAWMYPFIRRPISTGLTFSHTLRGTFAEVNGSVLSRAQGYQNQAQGAGKNFARAIKGLLSLDNPDGVVGVTSTPIPRHGQGYFVEVEVLGVGAAEESVGCLGLGVSFLQPETQIEKIPRRLEKIEQGWFFSGPYYGQTRRLYKDGQKDIRYILDGEDSAPIKWKVGDRMSILVRPKDCTKADWIWTISMYANRDIVMACHMDLHPWLPAGTPIPKELEMYAFAEAFGYVNKLRICNEATPAGLEIPFKPKALKEAERGLQAAEEASAEAKA
ncbi:unnamed protein product [Amoebophrya sp. A25]|nr:unnamed protein product [Amoebophrya sp. A25]|eukprot:GSA25T00002035001.1